MEQPREIIQLNGQGDFFKIAYDENKDFQMMEDKSEKWDVEKGSSPTTFVVKRIFDGKYFRGKYIKRLVGTNWVENLILTEVFEEKIYTVIYK